jgi:WD40 repeat protein
VVWDADTGREALTLPSTLRLEAAVASAWSPDGKRLASGSADGTAKVWDTATGQDLATLFSGSDSVSWLAWSPDGKRLVAVLQGPGRGVRAWDAATFKETSLVAADGANINWLSWAPDGRRLATGDFVTARVWDVASGKEVVTPPLALYSNDPSPGRLVAWSPDGRRLAVVNPDWTVRVWDAAAGKETLSLGRSRGVVRPEAPNPPLENRVMLAWSGDGKRLASSASLERTIQVWDPVTGAKVSTLPGHLQQVRSLA